MKYILNKHDYSELSLHEVHYSNIETGNRDRILKAIGSKIRELRLSKSLTLKELAYRINKDPQSIHRIEMGQINPSIYYMYEVAFGLDVTLSSIFSAVESTGYQFIML